MKGEEHKTDIYSPTKAPPQPAAALLSARDVDVDADLILYYDVHRIGYL